jgi:hypothetical protein
MKIFWSWQSDTSGKTGRHFVRDALDEAVAALKLESSPLEPGDREALHVDQDRQGVSGSRDLFPEIVKKIVSCDIFVADVTPIGSVDATVNEPDPHDGAKKLINSNVAIELGFAFQALGDGFVLLVMNNYYGRIEELPFDLRHKGGIIAFTLPPDALKEERVRVGKMLAKRFISEIELCASMKAPAAAPTGLIAIGPDVVCEGEVVGIERTEWSIHLTNFVIGDIRALIKYVDEFQNVAPGDQYIIINAMGDGRKLTAAPSLTKQGTTYIVKCAVAPATARIAAQEIPRDISFSPIVDDLHLEKGDIATVSGLDALPQRLRSGLGLIRGESAFDQTAGSRLQDYYWRYRDKPWLEQLFALEVIRLAAIPHDERTGEKRPPLLSIERVQSVKILAAAPANDRLPVQLELDVKGIGIWEHEVDVLMPSAEMVKELSLKGEAMDIYGKRGGPNLHPFASAKDTKQLKRNRKRLSVITKHHRPTGLELEIRYQPESLHIGLSVKITVLGPAHAVLRPGVPEINPAPTLRGYILYKVGQPFEAGAGTIKLRQDMRATKTTVMAIAYLVPSDTSTEPLGIAKVRVEIVTDVGELVTEEEMSVSSLR